MLRLVHGKLPQELRENRLRFSLQLFRFEFLEGGVLPPPYIGGDPSAGSPTDTLLRLNLPC